VILLDSSGNNQVLAEKIDKDEKEKYRKKYLKDYKTEIRSKTKNWRIQPKTRSTETSQ